MNPAYEPSAAFKELLNAMCEGELSAAQAHELETIVENDDDACWYYLCHIHLHGTLHWDGGEQQRLSRSPEPLSVPALATPPTLGFLSTTLHGTVGYFSSGWPVAYLAATVIFGLGLLLGSLVHVSQPPQVARQSSPPSQLVIEPKIEVVGRITGMVNCQWADRATEAFPGEHVPLGHKYSLASGLMEITCDSGAKVILQGPVTYEVESKSSGFLSVGKLTARMEKKGSGFRVQGSEIPHSSSLIPYPLFAVRTPAATVTDLGTEFGVEVAEDGRTDVHVFSGSVRAATAVGDGASHDRIFHAGEVAHIQSKSLIIAASDDGKSAKRFVRTMPLPKPMRDSQAYAQMVLSLGPAVYYRMEPPTDKKDHRVIFDSSPGGHHGTLYFSDEYGGQPYSLGHMGWSLVLRGPLQGDHAIVPDYPKTSNDQLTVSAWVMAWHLEGRAFIAGNWGHDRLAGGRECTGQFLFGVWDVGNLAAHVTQHDGRLIFISEPGSPDGFPRGQWLHVALSADETTLRLYRNGVEVASRPCHGISPRPLVASLGIGCKTNSEGTHVEYTYPCYWCGRIDELAIFNRALSTREIKALYEGPRDSYRGNEPL